MARRPRVVQIFDGVWIDTKGGSFTKRCSVCGPRCRSVELRRWIPESAYYLCFRLAQDIAAASVAKSPAEFKRLVRELETLSTTPNACAWIYGVPDAHYEQAFAWLRQALGFTRAEILASLHRIARCKRVPPGYIANELYEPATGPRAHKVTVGIGAAAWHVYPALLALADSCAEFDVLAGAAEESGERLKRKLEPACRNRGVSAWEAAALHIRQFLRILRQRHRYALLAGRQ